ncbi:hypothetical protein N656DRAFT_775355 [Canariomyces notabilis]|uniref:Uncharacterized protein n=1 Tax=Canariomyces notabilis TaxID=2074819 RepID=A0AAN6TJ60_9PEZI|nr:hypothetical protein N656DRAFT_775355 [Canariomyces arenarius]
MGISSPKPRPTRVATSQHLYHILDSPSLGLEEVACSAHVSSPSCRSFGITAFFAVIFAIQDSGLLYRFPPSFSNLQRNIATFHS